MCWRVPLCECSVCWPDTLLPSLSFLLLSPQVTCPWLTYFHTVLPDSLFMRPVTEGLAFIQVFWIRPFGTTCKNSPFWPISSQATVEAVPPNPTHTFLSVAMEASPSACLIREHIPRMPWEFEFQAVCVFRVSTSPASFLDTLTLKGVV